MRMPFVKAQATGNDFILVDGYDQRWPLDAAAVRALCHRRYGIGADGLIVLSPRAPLDYMMLYYNADGAEGSMCGNGGRAAFHLMQQWGRVGDRAEFVAHDGSHRVERQPDGRIRLELHVTQHIDALSQGDWFVNTGSPHHVRLVADVAAIDVPRAGSAIRHDRRYAPGGTNVNFVAERPDGSLDVRTFERGVEAETLSCGTGVTAAALVAALRAGVTGPFERVVHTPGGTLSVARDGDGRVFLIGPAAVSFSGEVELDTLPRVD